MNDTIFKYIIPIELDGKFVYYLYRNKEYVKRWSYITRKYYYRTKLTERLLKPVWY